MKNIIETLEDSENLSVFLDLIRMAGMEPMLRERGPFTVFVPTDEAFLRVEKERMDEIRRDADKLLLIVSYHVVPGILTSEDLRSVAAVRSSLGTDIVAVVRLGITRQQRPDRERRIRTNGIARHRWPPSAIVDIAAPTGGITRRTNLRREAWIARPVGHGAALRRRFLRVGSAALRWRAPAGFRLTMAVTSRYKNGDYVMISS